MIRTTLMSALAMTATMGIALSVPPSAAAQVTDQTDQSEEDWRKSRKKSGTTDIYRTPNSNSTGSGRPVDFTPISPVETLPSNSRRHLMRERAKAIAESADGDIADAAFVPSEAARTDDALMRDEREAWDVIVTDAQGSGPDGSSQTGQAQDPADQASRGGVAVSGQGSGSQGLSRQSSSPRDTRGGSARSLQDIMDAIKTGTPGNGSGQGTGQTSGQTQSGASQSGKSDPNQDAGQDAGQNPDGQTQLGGNAQATANADGQSQTKSHADSQAESQADSQAESQVGPTQDTGQAQSNSPSASQSGEQSGSDAQAQADASATRQIEPLSPLERIQRSRDEQPVRGTQRSASDYLGQDRTASRDD